MPTMKLKKIHSPHFLQLQKNKFDIIASDKKWIDNKKIKERINLSLKKIRT